MADVTQAYAFLSVWYQELMRNQYRAKGYSDPFVDGTVVSSSGSKAKVKLRNGSEISASTGMFARVQPEAYVLLLKHFKLSGYIHGVPNYIVGSYEIIGVRYYTESGTLSKTYRV